MWYMLQIVFLGTEVISLQRESQGMLSLLLLTHVCLPLYVYVPCVKAYELEQFEMVNGSPEQLILKSSSDPKHCPFQ